MTAACTAAIMAPLEAAAYAPEIGQKFKKGYESLKGVIKRHKELITK